MVRENAFLSNKQIDSIKTFLLEDKQKLLLKEREQDHFCLDKNELSDVLDEASINIQTQKELRFRNREIFYLKKINKALDRIEKGLYGLCEDCDDEISYERLIARPTAELCIGCKEEAEFSEKNNFILNKSKSLGKTMSEMGRA
jgi:DnaK suppressor protein